MEEKPSPLMGEGQGGGERPDGRGKKTQEIFYGYRAPPLPLTLSPKGRGKITFDNTRLAKKGIHL